MNVEQARALPKGSTVTGLGRRGEWRGWSSMDRRGWVQFDGEAQWTPLLVEQVEPVESEQQGEPS